MKLYIFIQWNYSDGKEFSQNSFKLLLFEKKLLKNLKPNSLKKQTLNILWQKLMNKIVIDSFYFSYKYLSWMYKMFTQVVHMI